MTSVSETLSRALENHRAGNLGEAERLYREIVRIDPRQPDALHLLGVAAHQRGRHEAAVDFICRAIAENGRAAPYYSNLAAAQRALGCLGEAAQSLERAVALSPGFADAHYNLGTIYKDMRLWEQAVAAFQKALELAPRHAEALNNLGIVFRERGEVGRAIECYTEAIRVRPEMAEAHNNLGSALFAAEQYAAAAASHERAIALRPTYAEAHANLGNAWGALDRYEEAIACYRRALELDPKCVNAHLNLGVALKELGRYSESLDQFERVLELRPDCAEAHVNRAFVRRMLGDLARGWEEFEWRWRVEERPPRFPKAAWDGSPIPGKRLLITAEQGVGDEIMFASLFSDAALRVGECIVECDARLVPLFARSMPGIRVRATPTGGSAGDAEAVSEFDEHIPMGSLGRFLRPTLESFPKRQGYLKPDHIRLEKWRARLKALGGELKVGISWRGGRKLETRRARSTRLEEWLPVLVTLGVRFISLQYGDCRGELAALEETSGIAVHHWADADPLTDMDDFAAQVAALDLVISVDNSTVHVAGAVGQRVWTLLPYVPDWRWLLGRDDSPWYPSMRLFRQSRRGEWGDVFAAVSAELARFQRDWSMRTDAA